MLGCTGKGKKRQQVRALKTLPGDIRCTILTWDDFLRSCSSWGSPTLAIRSRFFGVYLADACSQCTCLLRYNLFAKRSRRRYRWKQRKLSPRRYDSSVFSSTLSVADPHRHTTFQSGRHARLLSHTCRDLHCASFVRCLMCTKSRWGYIARDDLLSSGLRA